MGAILTYSGVSVYVVVFAVYPFAAKLFRQANIPKRLIPEQSCLERSRLRWMRYRITTNSKRNTYNVFKTDIYAAPILGIVGQFCSYIRFTIFRE